jgi:hypothetical protein
VKRIPLPDVCHVKCVAVVSSGVSGLGDQSVRYGRLTSWYKCVVPLWYRINLGLVVPGNIVYAKVTHSAGCL